MRAMYDSITPTDIPTSAQMVAGYINGTYTWPQSGWDRFPHAVHVRIATRADVNDGHVLDVEPGDATPSQAPGWVRMRRAAGVDPTVYTSFAVWADVRRAFAAAGVPEPHYWIAHYGPSRAIPAGAVALQYADPSRSGGHYDLSAVADYWPGVDPTPPITHRGGSVIIQGSSTKFHAQALADGGLKTNLDATTAGADGTTFPRLQVSDEVWDALEARTTALDSIPGKLDAVIAQIAALQGAVTAEQAAVLAAIKAQQTGGQPSAEQMTALAAQLKAAFGPAVADELGRHLQS